MLHVLGRICKKIDDDEIDTEDHNRRRLPMALSAACLCLLLVHYLKFDTCFLAFLALLSGMFAETELTLRQYLAQTGYLELCGHVWWSAIHVIGFLIIPLLVIRFLLGDKLADYHLAWGKVHTHWRSYLALVSPILLFIVLVTLFRDDFTQHYPFYSLAGRSVTDFMVWETAYIVQFIALEFFFRGFLLGAAKRQLGSHSVFIMMLPYMMIHLPKLWLEASGAILFGLFLGLLALRSRSIWGGVCVHVAIALSMDVAALLKQGAWLS